MNISHTHGCVWNVPSMQLSGTLQINNILKPNEYLLFEFTNAYKYVTSENRNMNKISND